MRDSVRHLCSACLAVRCVPLLALLAPLSANASFFPHTYYVGAGAKCDFSLIQDAIAAASATAGDVIVIDGGQTYSSQHLTIAGKSVTLKAGPCGGVIGGGLPSETAADAQVTLSGNDGASTAVLTMTGTSNVTLIDLKFTGNKSSGNGGGIEYSGGGTLTLTNVAVTGNTANNGGGIEFVAAGADATLVLGVDTQITGNTANGGDLDAGEGGGGVRVVGSATLKIRESGNLVFNNHAPNGYGGGVELLGAVAIIDSPGYVGNPLIWANDAEYGGGIAAVSTDPGDAVINIGARDPNFPVRIESNFASHTGGGLFLKPNASVASGFDDAALFANSFRIDGNVAIEGSAIYVDSYTDNLDFTFGGHVYLSRGICSGLACNTIDGNKNEDGEHNPTGGSTILLQSSYFTATAVHMRGNAGAHVIRGVDSNEMDLADSLLAENNVTAELIATNGYTIKIDQCTVANNLIGASHVINTNSDLTLTNSVIGELGTLLLNQTDGGLIMEYVVADNTGGLPASPNIVQADPFFFDIADSDYRLRVQTDGVTAKASPAVDFAPATSGDDHTDIGGRPRDVDVASLVDRFGPRDLGAYEMQPITERVFASAFGDPIQLVQ